MGHAFLQRCNPFSSYINWPSDFFKTSFGINRGFNHEALGGKEFSEASSKGDIIVLEANSNEQNFKKLEAGRIDFYINDKRINIEKFPTIKKGDVIRVKRDSETAGMTICYRLCV